MENATISTFFYKTMYVRDVCAGHTFLVKRIENLKFYISSIDPDLHEFHNLLDQFSMASLLMNLVFLFFT